MTPQSIQSRFASPLPLFFLGRNDVIKFELKPYLQPFEQELAMRELHAVAGQEAQIGKENGLWIAKTNVSEEFLRSRLTYWQRVGRTELVPTLQKALEFTQYGMAQAMEQTNLHRTRRLRYGPHNLHEYRGKFFPQLVRSLINISCISEKSLVLDPMCGSGTTPCEAVVAGMSALGADLNPLSSLVSRVKSSIPKISPKDFEKKTTDQLSKFEFREIDSSTLWNKNDLLYLEMWFDFEALQELAAIISEINKIRPFIYRDFFRVCFSNVVRSVSWQKSTDLRVRKEVVRYSKGTAQKKFLAEVNAQINRIYPYLSVLNFEETGFVNIRNGDAIDVFSVFPEYRSKVDLLVTSPPYATALPYLDTDRLSLILLGLLPRKRHRETEHDMIGTREITEKERCTAWNTYVAHRVELPKEISALIDKIAATNHGDGIGFRRRNLPALLGKYFFSMLNAMRSAHKLMKPGSLGYYVVGNNSTNINGEKIDIPTDHFLFALGKTAGWTPIQKIPMELIVSRDIFRKNRGSSETILCFRA